MPEAVVSKSDFARMSQVTPTRVGQWIREGKISADALVGEGRFARIRVDMARQQLRLRTDVGQSLGNGLLTRLEGPVAANSAGESEAAADPFNQALRRERLRTLEFQNRALAEAELERRGRYLRADAVKVALAKVSTDMVSIFEGALADFASALSAKFELPQREVVHLLRSEFRTVRANAAKAVVQGSARVPGLVTDIVEDEAGEPVE